MLFLRTIAVLNENSIYKSVTVLRAAKYNGNIAEGMRNEVHSVIFDLLKTATLFEFYNEIMRMINGLAYYSKGQWKQMVWKRAWELEKDDRSFRHVIFKTTLNLKMIENEGSYIIWWQISDFFPVLIKQCELMAKLVCGASRGPHRYTRTVRVPIPRPKIPVINRINSSRYFFTGTMNKMPRC